MEKITITEIGRKLAESHVEWFLGSIKPLLIEHFEHGFKHGLEARKLNWVEEEKETKLD